MLIIELVDFAVILRLYYYFCWNVHGRSGTPEIPNYSKECVQAFNHYNIIVGGAAMQYCMHDTAWSRSLHADHDWEYSPRHYSGIKCTGYSHENPRWLRRLRANQQCYYVRQSTFYWHRIASTLHTVRHKAGHSRHCMFNLNFSSFIRN